MSAKITRDILESYLDCKFKAHLKLVGGQCIVSDGEVDRTESKQVSRKAANERFRAPHG